MALVGLMIVMVTAVYRRTTGGYQPEAVAFSPDGSLLAAQFSDGRVRAYNPTTGEMQSKFDVERGWLRWGTNRTFALMDRDYLLTSDGAGQFIILDSKTGESKAAFSTSQPLPFGLPYEAGAATSGNGERVAKITIGANPGVEVFQTHTGQLVRRVQGRIGTPQMVALDHEGKLLVAFRPSGEVQLWNVETGVMESALPGEGLGLARIAPSAMSSNGGLVARVILERGEEAGDEGEPVGGDGQGDPQAPGDLPWPDNDPLGADDRFGEEELFGEKPEDGNFDMKAEIVNLLTGEQQSQVNITNMPSNLLFSPDGTKLALVHNDGEVELFDAKTGASLGTIAGGVSPQHAILDFGIVNNAAQFSPDGNTLAVGSYGQLTLYDANTLKLKRVLWRDQVRWQGYLYTVLIIGWGVAWGLVSGSRQRSERASALAGAHAAALPRLDPWTEDDSQPATPRDPSPFDEPDSTEPVQDLPVPQALKFIWAMMIGGGLIAVLLGVGLIFGIGSCYAFLPMAWFSMLVGAFTIARGVGRTTDGLYRGAIFQVLNIVSLDAVNFVLGLIEVVLLRSAKAKEYLRLPKVEPGSYSST